MEWETTKLPKILHFKHDVAFVCRGGALAPPICSVSLETSKWPKFTQILGEVSVRAQHMTGIKASAQLDGAGRGPWIVATEAFWRAPQRTLPEMLG